MEIEIILTNESESQNVNDAALLTSWIRSSRIKGVSEIEQRFEPPKDDEMGPTLLAIIGVILGAEATVEMVKQIKGWISATKNKTTVTVVKGDIRVVIDGENLSDEKIQSVLGTSLLS